MDRKYVDCRDYPGKSSCSLKISGTEEEVMKAATAHAVNDHGEKDTPEFRSQLRSMMKTETEEGESTSGFQPKTSEQTQQARH